MHVGKFQSFFGTFKETTLACILDMGGLLAGFMIALQLNIFDTTPWAIALYPAVISVKAIITGLLTGRLSTALHLGTVYPRFFGNTKSFYRLIGAMVVLTLATSATISLVAMLFGTLFWGVTISEFPAILTVMVATLSLGLLITLITIKFTFISFKRGLDPDTIVYPAVSILANIIMTFLYIGVLNLYFSVGQWAIILFGLINVFLVLYILPLNSRDREFRKIIKESLPTILLVAFLVNITGTFLKGISNIVRGNRVIYTVYPAMIDMMGDAGLVVSSAATVKLTLGVLSPTFGAIKNHAKSILSAWASTLMFFTVLAVLALAINGSFTAATLYSLMLILLVSNVIAFTAIVIVLFVISILTFKYGLDPDNFVIPLVSALADALTTIALFVALLLLF
ncbi:MAG: magnesium transporter [Nitrososphaerota archaeon]|jgi:mgtE-like transporter|uniref:magnesium transporter n=1 Tax=Candidatus Bathycorpusculum sp. TaxID=2994959 RepID=UPI0028273E6B|nr:magnesium transporter [Candidatus Termitimicrobium sp.]MCL2431349.1 magnesium transporter [Candidatus Termitimicrobium sp.]MDR0493133.1 magnesium transporter [Nitrososphaerota archaeon]